MDSLSVYNLKQVFINISDMENYIKKKKNCTLLALSRSKHSC